MDIRSIIRAVVVDLIDSFRNGEISPAQGASTLTMELVRNVIDDRETTLQRKVKEALLAGNSKRITIKTRSSIIMSMKYTSAQVSTECRPGAEYYFDKDVEDITMSEAALLVALIRNPGYYSPYKYPERALNIRNTILNLLAYYDRRNTAFRHYRQSGPTGSL